MTPLLRPPSDELARLRVPVVCWGVDWALPVRWVAPLRELPRPPVRRFEAPTTPCARLRCAPSEAARANVLPHSGQVNVSSPVVCLLVAVLALLPVVALRDLAIFVNASFHVSAPKSDHSDATAVSIDEPLLG